MDLGLWMLLFKQNLLNTKQCLGNNYKKFRYVETHDMKVGLQCLELKASIHFILKCCLIQIKDLITLSKDLWWSHRKYIKDSFLNFSNNLLAYFVTLMHCHVSWKILWGLNYNILVSRPQPMCIINKSTFLQLLLHIHMRCHFNSILIIENCAYWIMWILKNLKWVKNSSNIKVWLIQTMFNNFI